MDFHQTYNPFCFLLRHLRWGAHIDFGVDPIGVGVTLSCQQDILWTSGCILTKFSWTYNWNMTKNWLDFCDIDLIFKVTAVKETENSGWGYISVFPAVHHKFITIWLSKLIWQAVSVSKITKNMDISSNWCFVAVSGQIYWATQSLENLLKGGY